MGTIAIIIMIIWAAAGVYDCVENARKPVGTLHTFLAGPIFWIIAGGKYLWKNKGKIDCTK